MKKQPLHYACDTLYTCIMMLEGLEYHINEMQLITVNRQSKDVRNKLDKTLTALRNKALREEGEYEG